MNKNLLLAIICAVLIAAITFLSAAPIGITVVEQTVESIPASQITYIVNEGEPAYQRLPIPIHTVTYTNTFLPRQKLLPRAQACVYNSESKRGQNLDSQWQLGSRSYDDFVPYEKYEDVVRLGRETKTIQLEVWPYSQYRGKPVPGEQSPVLEKFDVIYLFLYEERGFNDYYIDCGNLQESDLAQAKRIVLI